MKTGTHLLILLIISAGVIISGCNESDKVKPIYGKAVIEDVEIQTLESNPEEVNVAVKGYTPDACTQIEKIDTKRENNHFNISITTTRSPDVTCDNLPYFFEKTIPLETQGLNTGSYYVTVNGENASFEIGNSSK